MQCTWHAKTHGTLAHGRYVCGSPNNPSSNNVEFVDLKGGLFGRESSRTRWWLSGTRSRQSRLNRLKSPSSTLLDSLWLTISRRRGAITSLHVGFSPCPEWSEWLSLAVLGTFPANWLLIYWFHFGVLRVYGWAQRTIPRSPDIVTGRGKLDVD